MDDEVTEEQEEEADWAAEPSQPSRRGPPKCHPRNQPFHNRLTELHAMNIAKGAFNRARTLQKAISSICHYPLALQTSQDAMQLAGIGPELAKIFDEVRLDGPLWVEDKAAERAWLAKQRRRLTAEISRRDPTYSASTMALSAGKGLGRGRGTQCAGQRTGVNAKPEPQPVPLEEALAEEAQAEARPTSIPSRPSLASKWRSAAKGRLGAGRKSSCCPPPQGSGQWCVMAVMGLYSSSAPEGCLAWEDLQAGALKVRQLLSRCDGLRLAAVTNCTRRGLLEEMRHGVWRLTEKGSKVADVVSRRLEVPATALSPLALVTREPPGAFEDEIELGPSLSAFSFAEKAPTTPPGAQLSRGPICCLPSPLRISPALPEVTVHPEAGLNLEDFMFGVLGRSPAESPAHHRKRSTAVFSPGPVKTRRRLELSPGLLSPRRPVTAAWKRGWPSPAAQLVLLLDNREQLGRRAGGKARAHENFRSELQAQLGAEAVESRNLELGDMLWVWREGGCEGPLSLGAGTAPTGIPATEYVAGWAVERKTFHDLASSIQDGRYDDQKLRLVTAPGLESVFYLVEGKDALFGVDAEEVLDGTSPSRVGRGFGSRLVPRGLRPAALATISSAVCHSQHISGLGVFHSTSEHNTIAFLVEVHKFLTSSGPHPAANSDEGLVLYTDFAEHCRKTSHQVSEVFGNMLHMICGLEAIEAIVDEFGTFPALAEALHSFEDDEELLQHHPRLKQPRSAKGKAPVTKAVLKKLREQLL